jgi:hypothetical protein
MNLNVGRFVEKRVNGKRGKKGWQGLIRSKYIVCICGNVMKAIILYKKNHNYKTFGPYSHRYK